MGRLSRFIRFLIMIIIGGGIGLYYAWYIKPAEFVNAALYNLRMDYKTDYVLMAAEIYDENHDRYHTLLQLDRILSAGEETEDIINAAIRNAEGLGYNPIDLEKMRRLKEAITGQRSTATPVYDPTMEYQLEHGSEAAATPTAVSTFVPTAAGNTGLPEPERDPFGTGVRATTDPNAMPMLDLPQEPTITPNGSAGQFEPEVPGVSSESSEGFTGIPDSFLDGR